jgi:eukaryotic-like serine/threonine-protein kinase
MPKPQLIGPVPASASPDSVISSRSSRSLPYDLLREASRRLGIMSLIAALLWIIATSLYHLEMKNLGDPLWMQLQVPDGIAAAMALLSIALFFYTRKDGRDPRLLLDIGLAYLVLTGLALGLVRYWNPIPEHVFMMSTISWIGAAVLMFAAIVPNSPARSLIAGLVAVSMGPLGVLVAGYRGVLEFGPLSNLFLAHYPDYILVGVSVGISHVVTKFGQQVTKAREMGSYRLETLLGKGGMGEVWRARHRMLARDAAIKLIQPETLSRDSGSNAENIRRRFEQEAKATASLRSPYTVELYDFGVTEDGVFYYVMEMLDGIDLETLVKRFGALPAARVVRILRQVCRSLAEAHRQGMIHRDIKPNNIFICRMGNEYDFAKVLDFGLVKMLHSPDARMTGDGTPTGTPAYMAPELALGSPEIDGRTDLYGLGCVAYWLLTGNLVFEEKGAAAMMLAHLQKAPAPPSQKSRLAVPESLDRLILMCLAKEPAERPATVDILARMLDSCDGVGSWTADDAERWWSANRPEGGTPVIDAAAPMHSQSETVTKLM